MLFPLCGVLNEALPAWDMAPSRLECGGLWQLGVRVPDSLSLLGRRGTLRVARAELERMDRVGGRRPFDEAELPGVCVAVVGSAFASAVGAVGHPAMRAEGDFDPDYSIARKNVQRVRLLDPDFADAGDEAEVGDRFDSVWLLSVLHPEDAQCVEVARLLGALGGGKGEDGRKDERADGGESADEEPCLVRGLLERLPGGADCDRRCEDREGSENALYRLLDLNRPDGGSAFGAEPDGNLGMDSHDEGVGRYEDGRKRGPGLLDRPGVDGKGFRENVGERLFHQAHYTLSILPLSMRSIMV